MSGGGVLGYAVLGATVLGVSEVAVTSLVAPADVVEHLDGALDLDEALTWIVRALGVIEGEIGRPLAVRQLVAEADCAEATNLVLEHVPCPCPTCAPHVTCVVDGVGSDGAGVAALTSAQWRRRGAVVSWQPGSWRPAAWSEALVVTYTAGYATAPSWLTLAVLRLIEHLWQRTQQAPHPALGQTGGGHDESLPSPGWLLPYAVSSLISPHAVLS